MDQKKLINDLKAGKFEKAYLLYGEERYLVSHYTHAIQKAAGDEIYSDLFDGAIPVHDIIMAAETLPFLSDRRLLIVQDSRLFATGRKDDSEKMAEYLAKIPDHTIIVFKESDIDRRSKMFKQISKIGCVIECTTPTPQTLATWVTRLAKEKGKTIAPPVAHQFVRTVGVDMSLLSQEVAKLVSYCANNEITAEDISMICTLTLESRIFDLTKAMGNRRVSDALAMYRNMLVMKESPLMILSMIIRQFRIMLLAKCAKEKGLTIMQSAKELGLRDFMVSEALGHGQRFTVSGLIDALKDYQETDVRIKTGLVSPEFGVEMLIVKYGQ